MPSEDITFCANSTCPMQNCIRHQRNIRNFNILHSFAVFTDCAYMRSATEKEAKSVHDYVESISTSTGSGITPPECCADCRFFDDSGDYPSCIALNIARGYNFDYCHKVMEDCPITKEKPNETDDIQ